MRDLLLKLHYLDLEINEIYEITNNISKKSLRFLLKDKYDLFDKLNVNEIITKLKLSKINYITILDDLYPNKLMNIFQPPLVLFYKGNIKLLNDKIIAVIGARDYSSYGEKVTKVLVPQLIKYNFHIISGLAYGIDTIVYRSSLESKGKTIAVLGSGFNNIYPKEHIPIAKKIAENHLLISEYHPDSSPKKTHFPFRNRIVSGLSDGILVIEAKERSGTLITCDFALDQGKEIFVIPNNIFAVNSVGTNNLIKQGATLVSNIYDIMENIG